MKRIIIFGLDGATFDLMRPWVAQGELPNMKRLFEGGMCGELKSVMPPMSPPAWTSFMTGKNQGKHGIFDFTERVPNSYSIKFINSSKRRAKTIWRIMSDAGKRVAVIGVPFTYPPEEIKGVMISGFDAPGTGGGVADKSTMHPPELYNELLAKVGRYYIASNLVGIKDDKARLEEVLKTLQRKIETASYLLKRERWDCFTFVIGETDAAAHYFWKYSDPFSPLAEPAQNNGLKDAILTVYKRADEFLGTILESLDKDTSFFIISDHGQGGCSNKVIYLNRWLEKEGFLRFEKSGIIEASYKNAKRMTLNILKQIGVTLPPSIKKLILTKTRIHNKFESTLRFYGIIWKETVAYAEETPYYPMIWINRKGREPMGIVSDQEYNSLRNRIIERLCKFTDPETGKRVVRHVYKREELYNGDYADVAPDLIIDWNLDNGYAYLSKSSLDNRAKSPVSRIDERGARTVKSGSHRDYGVFMAYGNNIKSNGVINGARLIDIAPTILYLLGLPIPQDMDGVVLREIFTEEFVATRPIRYSGDSFSDTTRGIKEYVEEDATIIQKRLADLGYL